ncbi:GAF domain-containing protein [Amnibacterium endophyticum]|uniref:GAF domain-containing protein n=1 Tax=Amnibacterium endophyticum TaxID=2109337 RepID=A0ABW4LD62_9MICO
MARIPALSPRMTRQRLHHSGVRPLTVLLIGERSRLLTAEPSLAQRAIDRVWLASRRGVDLDALTDLVPALRRVAAGAEDWRVWRYDVVVVLIGAALPARRREQALEQAGHLLRRDAAHGTPVVLVLEGPDGGDEQRLLVAAEALGGDALHVVRSDEVDDRTLAVRVGAEVEAVLRSAPARGHVGEDETDRQRALDDTGIVERARDPRLDDLVELARTAFGTESAEINFIDHDRQWKLAVAGGDPADNPRAHSFCNQTIRRPEPLVVGDTRLHPLLRRSPLAHGPAAIRFYAAYPIESIDGYRIGSFCVYDSQPRDVRGLDLAVLRDLALLAQAELIPEDSAPQGLSDTLRRP